LARHARSSWRITIGAALVLSAGTLSSCVLAAPARARIGSAPAALNAENVTFPSASGSVIHGWLVRGRPGAGGVLLLHGVGSNRTSMLRRAQFLHAQGFAVLAPDFQAHGESPGDHVTFGARESLDAVAAMAFLRDAAPNERIGVIGVSMGGAASLLGANPLAANAFVLESVYPTIRQAVSDRLATWLGPFAFIGRGMTPAVISMVGAQIGVREEELQPIARIGSIQAPLLLIAGTRDHYTPLAEAESLFAHAPHPKSFWAVDGAGHEDLRDFAPEEYERRVGTFLTRTLRDHSD
jgi:pimeloyl-ACP methyl ester carboxylesterase